MRLVQGQALGHFEQVESLLLGPQGLALIATAHPHLCGVAVEHQSRLQSAGTSARADLYITS